MTEGRFYGLPEGELKNLVILQKTSVVPLKVTSFKGARKCDDGNRYDDGEENEFIPT